MERMVLTKIESVALRNIADWLLDPVKCKGLQNENLFSVLVEYIEELINNNFSLLVSILYRMDVSESKIRSVLKASSGHSAGNFIAMLMIQREIEKIKSREKYRYNE